jgi:hypothetical protein
MLLGFLLHPLHHPIKPLKAAKPLQKASPNPQPPYLRTHAHLMFAQAGSLEVHAFQQVHGDGEDKACDLVGL